MVYLIIIILLLIILATVRGIIYVFTKLSFINSLLLMIVLIGGFYTAFKVFERNLMLSYIPNALGVTSIAYSKEESWGFGPGGNEAGIITYPLSETVSKDIETKGMDYFLTMPANKDQQSRDWRGRYETWKATPITSVDWKPKEGQLALNVNDYICRYGFCIDIDSEVVRQANLIVNSPGGYYAYGRIGLIVVSPKHRLVLYMYNG